MVPLQLVMMFIYHDQKYRNRDIFVCYHVASSNLFLILFFDIKAIFDIQKMECKHSYVYV